MWKFQYNTIWNIKVEPEEDVIYGESYRNSGHRNFQERVVQIIVDETKDLSKLLTIKLSRNKNQSEKSSWCIWIHKQVHNM